jgi:hypothetical protein
MAGGAKVFTASLEHRNKEAGKDVSSDCSLTGMWFAELAALRERSRLACDEMRAAVAEYQNLQVLGTVIREEAEHARRRLRLAVRLSGDTRDTRRLV